MTTYYASLKETRLRNQPCLSTEYPRLIHFAYMTVTVTRQPAAL